ncbi:MAG: hypothetical protein LBP27_04555 [Treponema sp.]|jgi:hypothetical protein|nr:hypothetical protein [Treponema sp.]
MNDKLFEEMLFEIDTMTTEDYWKLYHDAENLPDFPPRDTYYSVMPVAEFSIIQSDGK